LELNPAVDACAVGEVIIEQAEDVYSVLR